MSSTGSIQSGQDADALYTRRSSEEEVSERVAEEGSEAVPHDVDEMTVARRQL